MTISQLVKSLVGDGSLQDDSKYRGRVHVDEQAGNFVQRVEDERVSPCYDSASKWSYNVTLASVEKHCKLTESQEVTSDKQLGRAWEHPNPKQVEDIHKVAHTVSSALSFLRGELSCSRRTQRGSSGTVFACKDISWMGGRKPIGRYMRMEAIRGPYHITGR